jgi:hypothetical protein
MLAKLVPMVVAAVGFAAVAAGAQNFGVPANGYFRLDWHVEDKGGRTTIAGYIYNDAYRRAASLRLLIEELDRSGKPIRQTFAWIPGEVPGHRGAYFEVPVPTAAAAYRVTVHSFEWLEHR